MNIIDLNRVMDALDDILKAMPEAERNVEGLRHIRAAIQAIHPEYTELPDAVVEAVGQAMFRAIVLQEDSFEQEIITAGAAQDASIIIPGPRTLQ